MMWAEIVAKKADWIGGTLTDGGDSSDRQLDRGTVTAATRITDMTFDGQWFEVVGKDFSCGGDHSVLGVIGCRDDGCKKLHLSGYGNHRWDIAHPEPGS